MTRSEPMRIVHLSDLHFTRNKNMRIWDQVVHFINDEVRPQAILVTGDVTDNASPAEFECAAEQLARLRILEPKAGEPTYLIVPGNHDRYELLGNRLRLRWWRRKLSWSYKEKLFENSFCNGQLVTPVAAADLHLGREDLQWKVRIIGLDSNMATWFAQGAITETSALEAGQSALADAAINSDLVIAMVHHHVLPIPAVERRAELNDGTGHMGGIKQLANVTGMLNAGVLMHHLSQSQVNLILHGHEHVPHQAVFRDAAVDGGHTVVLAAGSGTGESTLQGWALNRVHFNVLELKSDRTVQLLQAKYDETQLSLHEGPVLLSGEDIRRARFVRRYRRAKKGNGDRRRLLPTSQLKTVIVVGEDRSANYVTTLTELVVKEEWSLTTRNPSGYVQSAEVTFEWDETNESRFETHFVPANDDNHEAFTCGINPQASKPVVKRCTAKWRWTGAIALSRSELNGLPDTARTGLRRRNMECVSLHIDETFEFASAALILHLPEDYAPKQVFVYFEDSEKPGQLQPSAELTAKLEFCGRGHVELRIPYPLPGFRYYIAWYPLEDSALPEDKTLERSDEIAARIAKHSAELFNRVSAAITGPLGEAHVRMSVYGPMVGRTPLFTRLAGDIGAPPQITMTDPRSRPRAALWGAADFIFPDQDSGNDLLGDERVLALIPVRPPWSLGMRGAALLRVALLKSSPLNWPAESEAPSEVDALFDRAALAASQLVGWVDSLRSKEG